MKGIYLERSQRIREMQLYLQQDNSKRVYLRLSPKGPNYIGPIMTGFDILLGSALGGSRKTAFYSDLYNLMVELH